MDIEEIIRKLEENRLLHGGNLLLSWDFGYGIEALLDVMGCEEKGLLVENVRLQRGEGCVTVFGTLQLAGEDSSNMILAVCEREERVFWRFSAEWDFDRLWEELFSIPRSRANDGSVLSYYREGEQEISVISRTLIKRMLCSFDTLEYVSGGDGRRDEKNCVAVSMETDMEKAPVYQIYHKEPYGFLREAGLTFSGTVYPLLGKEPQFAVTARMSGAGRRMSLQSGNKGTLPVNACGLCIHTHIPDMGDYRNYQEGNTAIYYVSEVQFLVYVDFGVPEFPEIFLSMPLFCIGLSYQLSITFGEKGLALSSVVTLLDKLFGGDFLKNLSQSLGDVGKLSLFQLGFVMKGKLFSSSPAAILVDVGINEWQTPFSFLYAKQAGVRVILHMWSDSYSWEMVLYGSFTIFEKLVLQGQVVLPYMEFQAELCENVESGKIALGEAIPSKLFPAQGLYLTGVKVYGNFKQGDYSCEIRVNPEDTLEFFIGKLHFAVKSIGGYISYQRGKLGYGIDGAAEFAWVEDAFTIGICASYEKEEWAFEGGLVQGKISFAALVEMITGYRPPISLDVTVLRLSYNTSGVFQFLCEVEQSFYLFGKEKLAVKVNALVENTLEKPDAYQVRLAGSLSFYEFLILVMVHFAEGKEETSYEFCVQFRELLVEASYKENKLLVNLENITIGGLLTMLFQIIMPNVSFRLPSPWDVLNRIGFQRMVLQYDLDTEELRVSLALDIELLVLQLTEISFTYKKVEGKPSFLIQIHFEGLLATDEEGVREWDVFGNEPVPSINGDEEQLFGLNYFGLSHHVDLGGVSEDAPLRVILNEIRQRVRPEEGVPEVVYNLDTGWFIGADFTVMESVSLCMLFYDPVIYGMQLEVLNDKVLPLKGLDITLYYRKITQDVGVFYVDLILPDRIKTFDVGAFSISLPHIQAWIYTNGQFKFNFGFPKNGDFSESAGISMGYYYGKGGFYIGYLDGDTSEQIPEVSNGYFAPVIELGIGVLVGIGKAMDIGVLKLKAAFELRAVFEGVFAQFHEKGTEETAMYYKCSALVVVAGELSGEVDFVIIKAGFKLSLYLAAVVVLEACEPGEFQLEAYIKVSAYVKLLFVKLSFSFTFHYKDSFVFESRQPSLWTKCGTATDGDGNGQIPLETGLFLGDSDCLKVLKEFVFVIDKYLDEITDMPGVLSPLFSREGVEILWGEGQAHGDVETQAVAAAILTFPLESFQTLLSCMVLFLIRAAGFEEGQTITKEGMEELERYLQNNRPQVFCMEDMTKLLQKNVRFCIEGCDNRNTDSEVEGVMLPFPAGLTLSFRQNTEQEENALFYSRRREEILYTDDFFGDAFYLLARTVAGKAVDIMNGDMESRALCSDILRCSSELAGQMNHFLLHGVRLERDGVWRGLFEEMGCQFLCSPTQAENIYYEFILKKEEGMCDWITFVNPDASGNLYMSLRKEQAVFPTEILQAGKVNWMEVSRQTEDAVSFFEGRAALGGEEEIYLYPMENSGIRLEDFSLEVWEVGSWQNLNACGRDCEEVVSGRAYTGIELELVRTEAEDFIQLYGMNEESREKLRKVLQENADSITDMRILFPASIMRKAGNAYWDYQILPEETAVICCNLSDVTTAFWKSLAADGGGDAYVAFLSEGYEVFLKLLLRAAEIGGSGHFLKYGSKENIEPEVFDEDGRCRGLLVIETGMRIDEYSDGVILPRKVDMEREKLLLFSKQLPMRSMSVMKPGWLGFTMEMPVPGEEDVAYHILYCQSEDDEMSYLSPPVSMQDKEGAEGIWSFAYLFPYYTYVSGEEKEATVFPEKDNPYAGIREGAENTAYSFFMADILGNASSRQSKYQLSYSLLYRDELMAVTEYPCTKLSYELKSDGEEEFGIKVALSFQQETSVSMEKLALAYYQLEQQDVTLELRYWLGQECYTSGSLLNKEEVLKYLEQLSLYLSATEDDRKRMEEPEIVLEASLPVIQSRETFSLYKWKVEMVIRRSLKLAATDTGLKYVAERSCLLAFAGEITEFAKQMEALASNVKVLERDGIYLGITGKDRKLFELRAGEKSGAYALAPLSTSPLSRSKVMVSSLSYAMEHLEEETWLDEVQMSFTEVDLDVWAQEYLAFYEELLSPAAVSLLLQEDCGKGGELLNSLLMNKKKLADRIKEQVRPIVRGRGTEEARSVVVAGVKNELEKNLQGGYKISGAYSYELHMDGGLAYAVEGSVSSPSVKPSKLMSQYSYVPFFATPDNPVAVRSVSMEAVIFSPQFLEEKSSGRWYRFVREFTKEQQIAEIDISKDSLGNVVQIPVILKNSPEAPVLTGQSCQEVNTSGIEQASWEYSCSFEATICAQDRIYIRYLWDNLVQRQLRSSDRDLFDYLACFYYQLTDYRNTLASKRNIQKLYQVFLKLSERICKVWGENPVKGSNGEPVAFVPGFDGLGKLVSLQQIGGERPLGSFRIACRDKDGHTALFKEEPNQPGLYVSEVASDLCIKANEKGSFTFITGEIPLREHQRGNAQVYITRNEYIQGGEVEERADECFVYRTPVQSFIQAIHPCIYIEDKKTLLWNCENVKEYLALFIGQLPGDVTLCCGIKSYSIPVVHIQTNENLYQKGEWLYNYGEVWKREQLGKPVGVRWLLRICQYTGDGEKLLYTDEKVFEDFV